MRSPSNSDFNVPVEGVGEFTFGSRTMRDELKIQAVYRRMVDGLDDPGDYLSLVSTWLSTLEVLMVRAPEKYQNLDAIDPLDPQTYTDLSRIFAALREKEASFRRGPASTVT